MKNIISKVTVLHLGIQRIDMPVLKKELQQIWPDN